jgi:hypothetical protein
MIRTGAMTFVEYMRWEGWLAIASGVALIAIGVADGHEGIADAVIGGLMLLAGTGVYMALRHRAPFRRPGAWFTDRPIAGAAAEREPCRTRTLAAALIGEATLTAALAVGFSFATGHWLTYMDFGFWALAVGAIKLGPARSAIARDEARRDTTYRVARRPLRGLVELAAEARA